MLQPINYKIWNPVEIDFCFLLNIKRVDIGKKINFPIKVNPCYHTIEKLNMPQIELKISPRGS